MEYPKISNDKPLSDESVQHRTELFNKYVIPHKNLIYKLCIRYSFHPQDVEDNYSEALVNFFKYIETYDPDRSIQTWLHIVTKRFVLDLNNRRSAIRRNDDIDVCHLAGAITDDDGPREVFLGTDNYRDHYSDEILTALNRMKPIYREALLLQQAGYKLTEIMEISYRNGNLRTKNIETVKSRLFLAKQQMRKLITRDGHARKE